MTTQVRDRALVRSAARTAGPQSSLYEVMASIGPVNIRSLAEATGMPRIETAAWLARQRAAGRLHFDAAAGGYSVACPWPRDGRRPGVLRRAAARALDGVALAWFGLMGDRVVAAETGEPVSKRRRLFEDPPGPLVADAVAASAWHFYIAAGGREGTRP